MARSLGIDPGTGSFDFVLVDGDRVAWERSIPTKSIAENPRVAIDLVREVGRVDVVVGPSGYGTPVVCNEDIVDPEVFASEVLLLTSLEEVERGASLGLTGMLVYKGLLELVKYLWKSEMRVCYIPSVILLPTVPFHRKVNKVDMGTVDKLASAVLGIYDQSVEYGLEFSETSFILVEAGFGYNAVLGVSSGKVVDGYGGTLVPNGMLTIGSIDGEVAVIGREWNRADLFSGGVLTICGASSVEEALERRERLEACREGFRAMYEEILKSVLRVSASVERPREVILSGRLARYEEIREELTSLIDKYYSVRTMRGLRNASISKESGQGYAVIGEGLAGGHFGELVELVEIGGARGTVLDYVFHPRLRASRDRLVEAYRRSLRAEALSRVLLE